MNCDKCQHKMIEVPLFTGFRFECKNCEEMEVLKTAFEDHLKGMDEPMWFASSVATHDLSRWFGDGGNAPDLQAPFDFTGMVGTGDDNKGNK